MYIYFCVTWVMPKQIQLKFSSVRFLTLDKGTNQRNVRKTRFKSALSEFCAPTSNG